jgi:lycopene cyclase domain-containing protein
MLYLLLNILVIFFPLVLSFDKRIAFWKRWPALILSYLTAGVVFVAWDVYATANGHWDFNEKYLIGISILGLPLEEILFFLTVPYACIFTYDVIRHHVPAKNIPYHPLPYLTISVLMIILAIIFIDQGYTMMVLISVAVLFVLAPVLRSNMLKSSHFWVYLGVTLILFLIVNTVLTAVPIVTYGSEEIWGGEGLFNGRFFTIPFEDFIYNVSLLSSFLLVYLMAEERLSIVHSDMQE